MRTGYRLALCIIAWICYLVSFNLYVLNLTNAHILPEHKKLWYCYTTGLILLFYTIDGWEGYQLYFHDAIAKCIMITIIINFVLITLIHHGFLSENPILNVCLYNGFCILISGMVFVSSYRNGLFKK